MIFVYCINFVFSGSYFLIIIQLTIIFRLLPFSLPFCFFIFHFSYFFLFFFSFLDFHSSCFLYFFLLFNFYFSLFFYFSSFLFYFSYSFSLSLSLHFFTDMTGYQYDISHQLLWEHEHRFSSRSATVQSTHWGTYKCPYDDDFKYFCTFSIPYFIFYFLLLMNHATSFFLYKNI